MTEMKRIHIIVSLILILLFTGCAKQTIMTWQEQYDLGIRYLNEGNYEEAIIAFTAAIEIDQKNVDAYLGRAEAYMNSNDTNGITYALADYTAVIEIDTTCEAAYVGMVEIYIQLGEFEKASTLLEHIDEEDIKAELRDKIDVETLIFDSLELSNIFFEQSDSFSGEVMDDGKDYVLMEVTAKVNKQDGIKSVILGSVHSNKREYTKEEILNITKKSIDLFGTGVVVDENNDTVSFEYLESEDGDFNSSLLIIGIDENDKPVSYSIISYKDFIDGKYENSDIVEMGKVVEAISYTRAVNPPWGSSSEYDPHIVSIPKISGNSVAIQNFNQKIMNQYKPNLDALKNGNLADWDSSDASLTEDQCLLYISYDYTICDGVVGILVNYTGARFGSSYWTNYHEYYFDTVADKELNFIEYLERLNVDFDKMTSLVNGALRRNDVPEFEQEPMLGNMLSGHRIEKALISENDFVAVYESQVGMGGTTSITIECPISDITSDKVTQKPSTSDSVQMLTDFYNNNKAELSVYITTYGEEYPNMINAYLADLDNDATPELCIKYIDSYDKCTHISIYRVTNGQVVLSSNCIDVQKESMGYMNQDWRLLLDGGEIRACIIYNNILYDDSIEYCVYNWSENNASVVEDIAFRSRKGVYEFSNTIDDSGYPVYSTVSSNEYTTKKSEYTKKFDEMMLDTDNCGFYDIWNLQK